MMRKATKQSRAANAEEKRHMGWVKTKPTCSACHNPAPLIVHHCEGSAFKANKLLVGHWFVLGLCQCCDNIVTRGSRKAFRAAFGPQSKLWLKQLESYPGNCPDEIKLAIEAYGK